MHVDPTLTLGTLVTLCILGVTGILRVNTLIVEERSFRKHLEDNVVPAIHKRLDSLADRMDTMTQQVTVLTTARDLEMRREWLESQRPPPATE